MRERSFFWLGEDAESLDTSFEQISQMSKSRRQTFTIRVPLAIARTVDLLVEGDDTLPEGKVKPV